MVQRMSTARNEVVTGVHYTPPEGYRLDVEVYQGPELRRRGKSVGKRLERVDFHVLLYVTRGSYEHVVDFGAVKCRAGSMVILRPGQVHRFGDLERFHGWLLLFRSEILPAGLELDVLPTHVQLPRPQRRAVTEALERIAVDAQSPASATLNALLDSQVHTMMLRIALGTSSHVDRTPSAVHERFRSYRAAVEREHRRWHSVGRYAKQLGCSEKSLNRAAREVADTTAKAILVNRIVLEAKRLLAHTLTPVATIGDDLGFSEPTNFVKFFRRETGTTPGAFRRRHLGAA